MLPDDDRMAAAASALGIPPAALSRPDPAAAAARLQEHYRTALTRIGLARPVDGEGRLAPYNLLVTRDWMLTVPRSRETWDGVSVNALGFAGALLVRDQEGLEAERCAGPLAVLKAVAMPP